MFTSLSVQRSPKAAPAIGRHRPSAAKAERAKTVCFDGNYYDQVCAEFDYKDVGVQPIEFRLGELTPTVLQTKWLCHNAGDAFEARLAKNERSVISTGIGLSGPPHMGTISQILRAIFLQRAGLSVQIVLGDLDSYNARAQPLDRLQARVGQYKEFIRALGFDDEKGVLRAQDGHEDVLRTAYLVARYVTDQDFRDCEEDLSDYYKSRGIYPGIEFPVKQSILLMVADFIHLIVEKNYSNVMVTLGLEEHKYVRLARVVLERMANDRGVDANIAGLYSRVITGLNGTPKMSKSVPGSAISVDTPPNSSERHSSPVARRDRASPRRSE